MRSIPAYIEKTEIAGAPIGFKWTGRLDHIGPVEGTALHDAIESLTHCGGILLGSTLAQWAVHRFHGQVDPQRYLAQADAVLAWTIHPSYLRQAETKEIKAPPAQSAMSVIEELLWESVDEDHRECPADEPPSAIVHVAFLVRHVLPKDKTKPFEAWMKWALKRLKDIAAAPTKDIGDLDDYESEAAYDRAGRPFFGEPLPPEALDPDVDYRAADRKRLLDQFLQSLDWKSNPFLRSPDDMKKHGFKGTPYHLR